MAPERAAAIVASALAKSLASRARQKVCKQQPDLLGANQMLRLEHRKTGIGVDRRGCGHAGVRNAHRQSSMPGTIRIRGCPGRFGALIARPRR